MHVHVHVRVHAHALVHVMSMCTCMHVHVNISRVFEHACQHVIYIYIFEQEFDRTLSRMMLEWCLHKAIEP